MWKRNHSLPEQIERGLVMNENLFRPQFDTLKLQNDQLVKLSQNNRWMTVIAASAGSLAALVSIVAFFIG